MSWEQVSGPAVVAFADPASASTSATFDAPGSYVLRLTASDSQASASDDVRVEVRAVNHAPLAEAGPDVAGLAPGATITLQGSVSDDGLPDGALTVSWSQVSGPVPAAIASPSLVTTLATFPAAGAYVLRLTASDGARAATDDLTVEVTPLNQAPRVSAGPDRVLEDPAGRAGAGRRGVGRRPARGSAHRALDGERTRHRRVRRPRRGRDDRPLRRARDATC